MQLKVSLLVPTYNGGSRWKDVLDGINKQDFIFQQKIIVDSGSKDDTVALARENGFEVVRIDQSEFNHGGTRQLLADKAGDADLCVFLTQDAIPAETTSVSNLIKAFDDDTVGLAYGRQLPHAGAKPIETHLRLYNYPERSQVKSLSDKDKIGFKVFFCSNSFAAYRRAALYEAGGFPVDSIMGEDALIAAKMLLKGYKIAYVAEATVRHSHSYTLGEDFRRYFDTRVFHEQNKWLAREYGGPTGEGLRYIRSELQYMLRNHPASLFKSLSSLGAKWLGYKTGKYYQKMPVPVLKKLSMHHSFWG